MVSATAPSKSAMVDFFSSAETDITTDSYCDNSNAIDLELSLYRQERKINVDANILNWWKDNQSKYPHMSRVGRWFLAVQATSVAAERVFSVAGDILTAKRSQLDPENVNKLIFLKKNMKP